MRRRSRPIRRAPTITVLRDFWRRYFGAHISGCWFLGFTGSAILGLLVIAERRTGHRQSLQQRMSFGTPSDRGPGVGNSRPREADNSAEDSTAELYLPKTLRRIFFSKCRLSGGTLKCGLYVGCL